jgi:hypothetical protein
VDQSQTKTGFGKGKGIQDAIPQYSKEGKLPKNFRNLKNRSIWINS